jgi:hypothetical protein
LSDGNALRGGESAFPGIGRQTVLPALDGDRRIAELERKIGQLTMDKLIR